MSLSYTLRTKRLKGKNEVVEQYLSITLGHPLRKMNPGGTLALDMNEEEKRFIRTVAP